MSFRPSVNLIAALLLPVLVAGCAAAPDLDQPAPTDTLAGRPSVVVGGAKSNVSATTVPRVAAPTGSFVPKLPR